MAGIALGYVFAPKKDVAYEQSIEAQLLHERNQVEEFRKKLNNAKRRDSVWFAIEMQYKDSLDHSRYEAIKAKKIYANINNTPAPKWTEPELDTLVSTIIR